MIIIILFIIIGIILYFAYQMTNKEILDVSSPVLLDQEITVLDQSKYTVRGMKNRNPLNVEYRAANNWKGQTGTDGRFCKFSSFKYGLRAGIINFRNGYYRKNLNTIALVIDKYLGKDQGKQSYMTYLSSNLGIGVNDVIPDLKYFDLIKYMINYEQGKQYFSDRLINDKINKYLYA